MIAKLPFWGFVPGQIIPITVCYENESSTSIELTKVNVKQFIRFNSKNPHRKSVLQSIKITETHTGGVKGGKSQNHEVFVALPTTLLKSNASLCRIVQVFYQLKVEGIVSKLGSKNIKLVVPIIIGSVPLNFENEAGQNNIPNAPELTSRKTICLANLILQFCVRNIFSFISRRRIRL